MSVRYLVDTDWAIHWASGNPDIVGRLTELRPAGLGVLSLAELHGGVYDATDPAGNEQALNDFLHVVNVIGLDLETCQRFARERGRLRAAKKLLGEMDLLIE